MKTVAVLGAGVTGVTTAYALQNRGFVPVIFDRHRYAAMETSYANGGQLSASNAEVWNRWSTVLKGLKWMMRKDAPLSVSLRPSWRKLSWMAEFISNIPNYRGNVVTSAKLAIAARRHLLEWAEREAIEFDRVNRGILHIYENQREFAHARCVTALLAEAGLARREVGAEELNVIEPALTGAFLGGYLTESDFTGDIHRYTTGLADAVARRGGRLALGTEVRDVRASRSGVTLQAVNARGEQEESVFDAVVVCAGVASRGFAARLGDRVPIYPVKGYSITVELTDEASRAAAPWVSLLDDEAKIVTSRLGPDRFRVAGTAEFSDENRDIRADRIRPLVDWVARRFPGVSTERVIPWAGLRPMTPSMMPRVGAGRRPGVFYNTGHGHLGWTLCAATAELVADSVAVKMAPQTGRAHRVLKLSAATG
ncbi:MAG: D-amino acid dehydrogenase [Rhodobacteraceae bacterium]|nr:D-amino acid dehydrogenase [Paracoccaceae bacterium]